MGNLILIVEDEQSIVDILTFNLEKEGYQILEATDGAQGLALALEKNPDLILLDLMLPKMDGFAVCRELRSRGNAVPIVMLTAREDEEDKVMGLELGADDYITKPFSMRELQARVRANIRRRTMEPAPAPPVATPPTAGHRLMIHREHAIVTKDGIEIELTQREFDLLAFLASSPKKPFSREALMEHVWNYEGYVGDVRAVDVAVRRLREKIEDDTANPTFILTKRGQGYYYGGD